MLSGPVAWLGLVVVEGVEWSSGLVGVGGCGGC